MPFPQSNMDIPRPEAARQRRKRQIIYAAVGVIVIVAITTGLSKLRPAAPSVERGTVLVDTVKRGDLLRQVRGLGTLVPEDIRLIAPVTEGRVEKILVRPGTPVKADTILVILTNPEVEQALVDAEFALRAAEAESKSIQVQRQSAVLNQKAEAARLAAEYNEAKLRYETDRELRKLGTISEQTLKNSEGNAQQLAIRSEIEQQRYANSQRELEAQMASQQARVEQLRAQYQLQRTRSEALKIRASTDGILQELAINAQSLQIGQQVPAGTTLARVADPRRLKAEIRVAETQAKDVSIGQRASIDTRNGVIPGRVVRMDPGSTGGTVTVDVALEGELPQGARPELSVEGVVDLENLQNILYVGRPAFGQERSTVSMFRLGADGVTAERVQVKLGRTSVNLVEIMEGLKEGDQVVLSDMSRWDSFDRIRLE